MGRLPGRTEPMTLALYGKSRRRQGLLLVLAVFAVFVAIIAGTAVQRTETAVAAPLTLGDVDGAWSGAVGTSPSITTNADKTIARWGTETDDSCISSGSTAATLLGGSSADNSGYVFDSVDAVQAFNDGDIIPLGNFTHVNCPITGGTISSINLGIGLDFTLPVPVSLSLPFTFSHNETDNGANPCFDGGANNSGVNINGCADRVQVSGTPSDEFQVGDDLYVLQFVGFVPNASPFATACTGGSGASASLTFWTVEGELNSACLYAKIVFTRPVVDVEKEAVDAQIEPGEDAKFKIVVANSASPAATGWSLSDALPLGYTWSKESGPAACTVSAGPGQQNLTCTNLSVPAGTPQNPGKIEIVVTASTQGVACGDITNPLVTIEKGEQSDEDGPVTIEMECPDGQVTKEGAAGPVNGAGLVEYVDWTVTVSQSGNSPQPTTVTDSDATATIQGANPCTGTDLVAGVSCTVPASPGSLVLTVRTTVPSYDVCLGTTVYNTATATGVVSGTSGQVSVTIQGNPEHPSCLGNLTVHKIEEGGLTNTAQTWEFDLSGPEEQSNLIIPDAGNNQFANLTPGTYSVTEVDEPGYTWVEQCEPDSGANSYTTFSGTDPNNLVAGRTVSNILVEDDQATADVYFKNVACAFPDVTIEKTSNTAATIQVGTDVSFDIKVTNLGPGTATNVVVTDNLSSKVTWNTPATAGCSIDTAPNPDQLICNLGDLTEGQVVTITLTGSTTLANPNSCGVVNNTAVVSADNEDPAKAGDAEPGPNRDFATVTVLCPDLDVTKVANPEGPVTIGSNIGFDITVTNSGDGVAEDINLQDTLPSPEGVVWNASVTRVFQNPATSSGTCSVTFNGGVQAYVLDCTGIDLAAGQSVKITVTATTSGATTRAACGPIINEAVWLGLEATSSLVPNVVNALVTITCPTVAISKVADATPVYAGDPIGFTIEVTAYGGDAQNVTVTDTLPTLPGVTWAQPPGCTLTGGVNLTCVLANVPFGDPVKIDVTGTTTASPAEVRTCGSLPNVATATYLGVPENSLQAAILVNCPDPKVEKTANSPVTAGDDLVYTITVTPQGTGTQNVTLTDTLPGIGLVWTVSGDTTGVDNCVAGTLNSGQVLSCTWNNLVEAKKITLTAVSTPAMCSAGPLQNTATISSAGDVDTSNNEDDATIEVDCPNVTLEKRLIDDQPNPVNAGEDISFVITATNNGDGDAKGFVLLDNLDPDVSNWQILSQSNAGLCVIDPVGGPGGTPRVECPSQPGAGITLVANGGAIWVRIKGTTTPAACGTVTNQVTATASNHPGSIQPDGAQVDVLCPDVGVNKVANPENINAGENAVFNITVDNFGTGLAKGVELTDQLLGTGLTWNVTAPQGVTCTSTGPSDVIHLSGETLTCVIGDLAGTDPAVVITLSATTSAPTNCGPLLNSATVSADNEPGDAPNANIDDATVNVNCAQIDFTKTTSDDTVSATDEIDFTIRVENDGSGTAFNVVVTDVLPGSGLVWALSGADAGSCTTPGGAPHDSGETLTCSFGTMAQGAIKTVTLRATTTVGTCPDITNVADLTSQNAGSAKASAKVTVDCPTISVVKTATGDDPVDAGGDLTYDIAVAISGPAGTVAKNVVLKEQVPANTSGWAIVSITGDALQNGSCTQILSSIICDFGNLMIPADGQLDYLIKLSAKAIGTDGAVTCGGDGLTNWAIVQAGNATEDRDDANVGVNCPNVQITKVAFDSEITAGEDASYTIEVSNDGAGDATGITINDPLPGIGSLVWSVTPLANPAPGEGCWILLGTLYCQFAEIPAGSGPIVIELTASTMNEAGTAPAYCGELVNELASVFVGNDGVTGAADTVENVAITVDCPDITVDKEPDSGDVGAEVTAGDEATFTIKVTNNGPGTATNVTLNDQLPLADTLDWDLVPAGVPSECSIDGNDVLSCLWEVFGEGDVTITVKAATPADICESEEGGLEVDLPNTATVAADNEDPNGSAPNSDTGQITVNCSDIVVDKEPVEATIAYFDDASYTIEVRNLGPGVAKDIKVDDQLSQKAEWAWTVLEGGSDSDCQPGGNADTFECTFDSLGVYDEKEEGPVIRILVYSVREGGIQVCGPVVNAVEVGAANEPESAVNASNADTATINVECGTVQVVKIDSVPGSTPSLPSSWTFTVEGPDQQQYQLEVPLGGGSVSEVGVPLGAYSVTEDAAIPGTCPAPNDTATYRTISDNGPKTLTEPNTTITFTFQNFPCGVVLDTGALLIEKVRDVNGNGVKDAEDTMLSNWPVTISGPQFNPSLQVTTDNNGIIFLPSIESGTYTITEGAGAGYAIVGVRTNGGSLNVSNTTQVDVVFSEEDTVTFYNQPRGSIVVTKSTIVSVNNGVPVAAPNDDDGWQITLTSAECGVNVTQSTGANGTTTFTNLELCSDYVVSENPVNATAPGYKPVGSTVVSNVTPGHPEAVSVTFVNRLGVFDGCTNINDCGQPSVTPTNTPVTPTNTPTATPTNTPTNTPTPEATVEGEKTPGPASPTPQAPDTGAGLLGGPVGGMNLMLVVAGFAALAVGMAFIGFGRRSRGTNR